MIFRYKRHIEFGLIIGNKMYTLDLNDPLLMALLIVWMHGQ